MFIILEGTAVSRPIWRSVSGGGGGGGGESNSGDVVWPGGVFGEMSLLTGQGGY